MTVIEMIAVFSKAMSKNQANGAFVAIGDSEMEIIEEWLNAEWKAWECAEQRLDANIERKKRRGGITVDEIKAYRIEQKEIQWNRFADFRFIKGLYYSYKVLEQAAQLEKEKTDMVISEMEDFFNNLEIYK